MKQKWLEAMRETTLRTRTNLCLALTSSRKAATKTAEDGDDATKTANHLHHDAINNNGHQGAIESNGATQRTTTKKESKSTKNESKSTKKEGVTKKESKLAFRLASLGAKWSKKSSTAKSNKVDESDVVMATELRCCVKEVGVDRQRAPLLASATKGRPKGPSGRRLPQRPKRPDRVAGHI